MMQLARRETLVQRAKSYVNSLFGSMFTNFGFMVREGNAGDWQNGNVTLGTMADMTAFGAVFACIARIANDIAKLELQVMLENASDISTPAPPSSPYWVPLLKPNAYQNRIQFILHWITMKLLYGNAYVLKVRSSLRGPVIGYHVLDSRRVFPQITEEGSVYYSLGGDNLAELPQGSTVPASEIIHDRYVTLWHPVVGVTPLFAAAMSALQGQLIQRNSTRFFKNLSRPSGMLTSPGTISDVTANRLKAEWEKLYSGENLGKVAVAGDGLKYEPFTIPANDAQLIQQLGWTVEDVARCFSVPLYKINSGNMPTHQSVEALEVQYYTGCLQPYIEAIELCLREGADMPQGTCVEFDLDGLLRMDTSMQIDMLTKSVGGTIMTPNEARARRNLPEVEGGNALYMQQQNYSLAALAKRDAKPDPFAKDTPAPSSTPSASPAPPPEPPAPPASAAIVVEGMKETKELLDHLLRTQEERYSALEGKMQVLLDKEAAVEKTEEDELAELLSALADGFSSAQVSLEV